jgi:phosphotriesterase-related protein
VQRSIVTVGGPRPLTCEGIVDAHDHLWIDAVAGAAAGAPVLDGFARIAGDLKDFRAAGGAAVVDCQPPGCGRNLERLLMLSRATGVDVVAATGFHLERYYAPGAWPWSADGAAASEAFVRELSHGVAIADGRVRAGVVKVAYAGEDADARALGLLEAACGAAAAADAAIVVHTERGRGVEALADLLAAHGVPPGRVMLSHLDKRPDHGLHRELAQAGFLLGYDTFLRPRYAPDDGVWPLLETMIDGGHAARIACGLDLADVAMWGFRSGAPGLLGLARVVAPRLRALGAAEAVVRALLGANVWDLVARPVQP